MRYKVIKQKPYCCVPACVKMILERRGITGKSQEELGYALGLSVPESHQAQFPKARKHKPTSGYGTEVQNDRYSLNRFFARNNIPLQEVYIYTENASEAEIILKRSLMKEEDILVCFNNIPISGKGDWGHVSLLTAMEGEELEIIDPELGEVVKVEFKKLMKAIIRHGKKNRAGFWLIKGK